jgi:hypothetical protein
MSRSRHPSKDVEKALQFAEQQGWKVRLGGHWGFLYCPYNNVQCRGGYRCKAGIWSTPANASLHAKQLKEVVYGCTKHQLI